MLKKKKEGLYYAKQARAPDPKESPIFVLHILLQTISIEGGGL